MFSENRSELVTGSTKQKSKNIFLEHFVYKNYY